MGDACLDGRGAICYDNDCSDARMTIDSNVACLSTAKRLNPGPARRGTRSASVLLAGERSRKSTG